MDLNQMVTMLEGVDDPQTVELVGLLKQVETPNSNHPYKLDQHATNA